MKKWLFFLPVFYILFSCSTSDSSRDAIETVSIDITNLSTHNNMIERMEVFPLETGEESQLDMIRKIIYLKEEKIYIIEDNSWRLFLFTEDGKFLRHSGSVYGEGPHQYSSLVDYAYNRHKKQIEILSITGTIKCYDLDFNYKETSSLVLGNGYIPGEFFPRDSTQYIVIPTTDLNENIFFLDTETREIHEAKYGNMIAYSSMSYNLFQEYRNSLYYIPRGINYYFHQVDATQKRLNPVIYLDFGKETLIPEELPGDVVYGQFNNKAKQNDIYEAMHKHGEEGTKRHKYLMESKHFIPLIKCFNEDYVYVHCIKKRKPYNFIYNRKTKEHFTQGEGYPIQNSA